jgi:hypothetical protein
MAQSSGVLQLLVVALAVASARPGTIAAALAGC